MAYRPYPNVDRALRQLVRGRSVEPPSEFQLRLAAQAQAALEYADRVVSPVARGFREGLARWAEPQPGRYVLSTRRPDTVSGGS